ncbi:MAG TPA: hypothetical protein VFX35_01360 [Solirubrobacterales bacterium]|nr:hypothetical protein [Solirubrobacterales bacterium]
MSLPVWKTDCGCTQTVAMGAKRVRFCSHGRPYAKVREDGEAKPNYGSSSLNPGKGFSASKAQRDKVKLMPCLGCRREVDPDYPDLWTIDPAHVWPKDKGGCDSPDCVLPLCRFVPTGEGCHRLFDEGRLDLTERLANSEAWQVEQAHPILCHGVGLVELVRRLSGNGHEFVKVTGEGAR